MALLAPLNGYFFGGGGQKRAKNDDFGTKSSSRKSSDVRLGPKCVEHLFDVVGGLTRAQE